MKFAIHFANLVFPDPQAAETMARAAEAAGFDSLITVERVVWPTHYETPYPYSPDGRLPGGPQTVLPDPLLWLAHVAAHTTSIELMTGILILPQRNPLVLAKEVASLDWMSGGRMVLGIGVGWLREEFEALGIPFARRGARTDEYIEVLRALWTQGDVSFKGDFCQFQHMNCNPKPVRGHVPIVIGGDSPQAAARAGRTGNGFFPATGGKGNLAERLDTVRRTAEANGRDPDDIDITCGLDMADPLASLDRLANLGVHRVVVPASHFQKAPEEQIAAFADAVIAPSRR